MEQHGQSVPQGMVWDDTASHAGSSKTLCLSITARSAMAKEQCRCGKSLQAKAEADQRAPRSRMLMFQESHPERHSSSGFSVK